MTVDCLHFTNPNPNSVFIQPNNLRPHSSFSFQPRKSLRVAGVSRLPKLLNVPGLSLFSIAPQRQRQRHYLPVVSFAASHEDYPSEGDTETEKGDLDEAGKTPQETWEQALASFKEKALKLQSVSHEAYEDYSKKAVVVLKETAETLKIQADQAKQDLVVMAQELGEDSRQFLTVAAENSPEPVKDVVETFASAEDLDDVSKVSDFYVGIPYGTLLSAGGFLNFMVTGSISALRFGVILGGILLALSVSSLRSWKKGQSTEMTLKGQAAIAGILFLRDIGLLLKGPTLFGLLKAVLSGSVAAFFAYRVVYGSPQSRPSVDGEANS